MKKKLLRYIAVTLAVLTTFHTLDMGAITVLADLEPDITPEMALDIAPDIVSDIASDIALDLVNEPVVDVPAPVEEAPVYALNPSTSIIYFEDATTTSLGQGTRVNISNRSNKAVNLAWTQNGSEVFNIAAPYVSNISPMDYSSFSISVNDCLPAGKYAGSLTVWITEDESLQSAVTVSFYIDVYEEKVTPEVKSVSIEPNAVSLSPGDTYSFFTYVDGTNLDDYTTTFKVSNATSDETHITTDGTLIVAANERASTIYVTAASKQNPNVTATATVSIEPNTYQIGVQANPAEGGVVTGGNVYEKGATAVLNASANNGYVFTGWTLNGADVANTNQYNVKVNASGTYVANFKKTNVYVVLDASPSSDCGTVTSSNYVSYGGDMSITATPALGYRFVGWKENNVLISSDSQYYLSGLTTDRRITACFEKAYATVQIYSTIDNVGYVSGQGNYDIGSKCTITATPYTGYKFDGWFCNSQLISTNPSYTINYIDKDYCFVAGFSKKNIEFYTIKASSSEVGGFISPSGNNVIPKDGSAAYTITPSQGYKISSVYVDGINKGAITNYTFSKLSGNHTIQAVFEKQAAAPTQDKAKKEETKAKTEETKAKKEENKTKTEENKAKTEETKAKTEETKAKPEETKAKPEENKAKPEETKAKTEENNTKPAEDTTAAGNNPVPAGDSDETSDEQPNAASSEQIAIDFTPGNGDIVDTSDVDYSLLTGVLATYNVTREEASVLIDVGQAEPLFVEAYMQGYLSLTVNTDYAQNQQPTATGDFYKNPSIANYTELMEKLFSKEELLDSLEGTPVSINVDITNYTEDIPLFYKQALSQIADGYNKQIDSYCDITLIKTNKYGSQVITDFGDVNGLFVLKVPKHLIGRDLSVIHYHVNDDGRVEKELLEDLDDDPDTITISVNKLSMFAIVEDQQHPVLTLAFKIAVLSVTLGVLCLLIAMIYLIIRKLRRKKVSAYRKNM